jgi:hypothetical protein
MFYGEIEIQTLVFLLFTLKGKIIAIRLLNKKSENHKFGYEYVNYSLEINS